MKTTDNAGNKAKVVFSKSYFFIGCLCCDLRRNFSDLRTSVKIPVAGGIDTWARSFRFCAAITCCGCVCACVGKIEERSRSTGRKARE